MLFQTHIVFSQASFYLVCAMSGHIPPWWGALLCAFFSVFPADIDHPQSVIGRIFPFISKPVSYFFGHRTLTHSLLAQVIVGLFLFYFSSSAVFIPVLVGWVSHSFADMMTPSGVCWFYPSTLRCVIPGHVDYRISIGSYGEVIFSVLMLFLLIFVYPNAHTGQGTSGLIRQSIGDISAATKQYNFDRVGYAWSLNIEGVSKDNLLSINGTYDVVASHGESGFIVLDKKGNHRTVCATNECDWYITRTTLNKEKKQITTVFNYESISFDKNLLLNELNRMKQKSIVYIIGELIINGKKTTMNYAELSEIKNIFNSSKNEFNSSKNTSIKIKIQVRHEDNYKPVFNLVSNEGVYSSNNINPLLNKWLQ